MAKLQIIKCDKCDREIAHPLEFDLYWDYSENPMQSKTYDNLKHIELCRTCAIKMIKRLLTYIDYTQQKKIAEEFPNAPIY